MQLNIVVKPFINVFACVLKNIIMLMIRYVTLCPHIWYPRVVQSATCPVRELTSPPVV